MASTPDLGESLPIWTPRRTLARFFVLSVAMVAVSLLCLLIVGSLVAQIVGGLGVAFFGLGLAWMTFRVVHPRPVVVLSPEGLLDRASLVSCGFVPWSNVGKAHVATTQFQTVLGRSVRQKFVVIPFTDVAAGLAQLSGWKQTLFRWNARLVTPKGGVGPGIPASQLPMTAEKFVALVNEWATRYSGEAPQPPF